MKILITESQFEKLLVLLEDNNSKDKQEKNQKIIDKLIGFGLSQKASTELTKIAGKISVFLAFKVLDNYQEWLEENNAGNSMNLKEKFNAIEPYIRRKRDILQYIVDWFRVGLNGNIKPYANLSLDELYNKSVEWHDSLSIGGDKIDYVEDNKVIVDFRKNGIGFYWVDLATNNCPEEKERMGHCASSSGRLYSLREYKPLVDKHTLNKSHLTMSLSAKGYILQLKGTKNSKPKQSHHIYILPLLYHRTGGGDYLINGFSSHESQSENDFKLSDLNETQVRELYSLRPSLFEGRVGKMTLIAKGIIEKPKDFNAFILSLPADHIRYYVKGSWNVGGRKNVRNIDVFESILSGDFWLVYVSDDYDWETPIAYYINQENENKIIELLRKAANDNQIEFDETLSLKEMIEEYDEDDEIKNKLSNSLNDANNEEAYNYFYDTLKNCLKEYGEVLNLDDSGAKIKIDLDDYNIDNLVDYFQSLETENFNEVFDELISDGKIEEPTFEINDYWQPNIEKTDFNEILSYRLDEEF